MVPELLPRFSHIPLFSRAALAATTVLDVSQPDFFFNCISEPQPLPRQFWMNWNSTNGYTWPRSSGSSIDFLWTIPLYFRTAGSATTVLDELEQYRWIDEHTRAVFVEFLLYNPSVNLFAISMLNFEFPDTGGQSVNVSGGSAVF